MVVSAPLGPGDPNRSSNEMRQTDGYPLIAATLVLVAFLCANAQGVRLQLSKPWNARTNAHQNAWQSHSLNGWPITYHLMDYQSAGIPGRSLQYRVSAPFEIASIWAAQTKDIGWLHGSALLVNLIVGTVIVLGMFHAVRAICETQQWRLRISIRMLLLSTTLAAVTLALRDDIATIGSLLEMEAAPRYVILFVVDVGWIAGIGWIIATLLRHSVGKRSRKPETTNQEMHPSPRVDLG